MQVEEELAGLATSRDTALTIGVFDGVHLGHKYLISRLTEYARQQKLASGVITFRQHPEEVLSSRARLPFLTTLAERVTLLKNEGVDIVAVLSFTPELAQLSARQFVELLQKYLRMKAMVVGPDFALGQNREGNIDCLQVLGEEMGFSVLLVSPRKINGEVISSTAIREALAEGDMEKASTMMGHPFCLSGRVVSGAARGAGLGPILWPG